AWCVGSSVSPLLLLSKPAGAWGPFAAGFACGATEVAKGAGGLVEHATAQRVRPNKTNPIKNFMALSRGLISAQIYACSAGTANTMCGPRCAELYSACPVLGSRLSLASPFVTTFREMLEMRYLCWP